ncbi:ANTAR domain-containing protein [Actinosynnema pretiosum subsp. pretiosum]|uniref:ANTAR domain-containing protein n=4 Tax=Actinosynnema TaxID=40566 RepID=C6W886_ACTMD|nr:MULTISPECIES: ANTAR domain-containing protein [Actinosynnema]ACU38933.1 ANTAR domain protein with unknown sensor [Actinosynnema mirum DSM 43827]ATE56198.1 ANTAR domain-containing protein [Actinosynnema pretiosum]QUF03566.1 ANTAR domain-containing protein [Actinosynnema pretiosum subsp. pretiosum]
MVGDMGQDDSLTARIASLEAEVRGLRNAVQTRTVIGQATGLIAAVQGCTPQQGFQLLVRMSQHHNVKLHTIAVKLIDLAAELGPHRAVRAVQVSEEQNGVPTPVDWPGADVVQAARQLVAAYDAATASSGHEPEARRQLTDQVNLAGQLLAERLTEVGWLPGS